MLNFGFEYAPILIHIIVRLYKELSNSKDAIEALRKKIYREDSKEIADLHGDMSDLYKRF
ncbi:MAG: hypothetical protein MRQ07_04245 [Candidatus Midichloria sp.]|nr:hypothetical protein [Candidatus Midichloria sp.]